MTDFPWTYDQLQRYSVLREFLEVFHPGGGARVLDVGGLSPDRIGTGSWLPVRAIHAGESVVLDLPLPGAHFPGYVRGDGTSLPFRDGSFDVVAALDVLEHIPAKDRASFLAELTRVAGGSVFVCAPFQGPENVEADELLYNQLRLVHGAVQAQLREHRLYGLPEKGEVERTLAAAAEGGSGGGFSYGSLLTWLPYQTIKNAYMMSRGAGEIQAGLDRWMSFLGPGRELAPPFARHYWVRSRSLARPEFDARLAGLRDRLRGAGAAPDFKDMAELHRKIVSFQTRTTVSGVVVSLGRPGERLAEALDSLLTQQVDFDLEAAVWDIAPRGEVELFLKDRYPGVKYFPANPGRPALAALGELVEKLSGDYFLLMSEDILLKLETVGDLAARAKRLRKSAVWAPVVIDSDYGWHFEAGRRENGVLIPREVKMGQRGEDGPENDWVRGECLFFDRAALWSFRGGERPLSRKVLFSWERVTGGHPVLVAGDMVVYLRPPLAAEEDRPPLRIVHGLHQYFPARGGAEWLMQNVSERLAARGHEVRVIATTALSTEDYFLPGRGKNLLPAGEDKVGGVSVVRVPFTRRGAAILNLLRAAANRIPFIPGGNRWRMISWGPRSAAYAKALAAPPGADLIGAAPLPNMNVWYAWRAARRSGLPFVIIPCFHIEDPYSFHNPFYYRMMRDAAAVIALTEAEKEFLCREARLDPEKVHVLGAGIDLDAAEPAADIRLKYGIRQTRIVLFLGQHGRHKGILELLSAMRHVWKECPDTAVVIAGNPTAHTAEIEAEIATFPDELRERAYLVKGVSEEEKRAFYQAADIFVSVSPFESFGIVYLEAWRERLPVIGCRRGAASKLIEEGHDGLLVNDANPIELAGAVVELLRDEKARAAMGETGYKKVVERFQWNRIIDRWEAIYREIHGKRAKA